SPTLDGFVARLAVQPDRKILIAGGFDRVNGSTRHRIARLNLDGSLDATFTTGIGVNNSVSALALQADGKLLIGGTLSSVNGVNRNWTARLYPDGSVDAGFN